MKLWNRFVNGFLFGMPAGMSFVPVAELRREITRRDTAWTVRRIDAWWHFWLSSMLLICFFGSAGLLVLGQEVGGIVNTCLEVVSWTACGSWIVGLIVIAIARPIIFRRYPDEPPIEYDVEDVERWDKSEGLFLKIGLLCCALLWLSGQR